MSTDKKYLFLPEAILCSIALMLFSFFIQYEFPARLVAFASLILPAWFFSRDLNSFSVLKKTTGEVTSLKSALLYCFTGLLSGALFGILYRWHLGISIFPKSIHLFVIVSALIGCTEELVFRGFIQDYVKSINAPFSILFSSIAHTAYKCCLFLSPMAVHGVNIGFLALWTMIAGALLGTIKHFSGSIIPPLIAHALFDVLVYAEFASAPWWVW